MQSLGESLKVREAAEKAKLDRVFGFPREHLFSFFGLPNYQKKRLNLVRSSGPMIVAPDRVGF